MANPSKVRRAFSAQEHKQTTSKTSIMSDRSLLGECIANEAIWTLH